MVVETEGPDRCNRTLNCIPYHDPSPELSGTLYNCCCCNTCTTLRPGAKGDLTGYEFHHCCRCVPRLLFLQFTPDLISTGTGTGPGDCCLNASVPMTYGGTDEPGEEKRPVTTYSGSLFGVSVTVELGRFAENTGTGTGSGLEDGDCAWHIVANKVSNGFSKDFYLPVDHETQSCLDVSGIDIGEVEGPEGCVGMLHLENAATGRIPFVKRTDAPALTEVLTGTGTGNDEFIDLETACGGCVQVCKVLCVYGHKTLGGSVQSAEFHWFETGTGTGTGEDRGWKYTDPADDEVYTIWLMENVDNECILHFDWDGSEILTDRVIDLGNGCACGIKEVVTASVGLDTIGFTIRCGYCTCWTFYCGTCRCVPRYLCASSYIDRVFTANRILTWDEDEKGWLDDSFTGTGTAELAIYLQPDGDGCVLVASVNSVTLETTPTYDCGTEHLGDTVETGGKIYDPANDFLSATWSDFIDGEAVFIMASALLDDCKPSVCSTATPCGNDCGSHPPELTAYLHGWNDPILDEPGHFDSCSVEVELHYYELFSWAPPMDVECGYIGFAYIGICGGLHKWVQVRLTDGGIRVNYWWGEQYGLDCEETEGGELVVEECDPYSADTGVIVTPLTTCCWSCDAIIQRYQITVSE